MTVGPPSRRFALLLEYDGTRFSGSQLQPSARTVQGVLEDAILKATGEAARVAFAGRTDAGVHARGQVAAFTNATRLDPSVLVRALNAWLPEDAVVLAAAVVQDGFDPRRQALRRHYRYVIANREVRPAIERERVWHVGGVLDAGAMGAAAQSIEGTHDFSAFASALEKDEASTVRNLERFLVRRQGDGVVIDAVANAFLPHQVRRMVGALVEVGRGKMNSDAYARLLEGPPSSAGPAAPARGLTLVRVEYAEDIFPAVDSEATVW